MPVEINDDSTPSELRGEEMAERFTRNLLASQEAMSYLQGRGITASWIEHKYVGLCAPYSDHWFALMRGRIVVPIRDVHGAIIAFAGRIYEPLKPLTERALWDTFGYKPAEAQKRIDKWNKSKWVNEPFAKSRHLYMLDYAKPFARAYNYIVIVEGYFDALVLARAGISSVAAVCGTALTEWHAALISRYCEHVVLMLDGDSAGERATTKIIPVLHAAGLKEHVIPLPQDTDPDQFVLKYGSKMLLKQIEFMIDQNVAYLCPPIKQV